MELEQQLPLSGSAGPGFGSFDSSRARYAFLVHSQSTLPHNLPPTVDNQPLARQKRRRTSPEDQAILEAEFRRHPKPDKTARARIVELVALGDKEVQIWFQNRRQNMRRRTRPLPESYGIAQPRNAEVPLGEDSDPIAFATASAEEDILENHSSSPADGACIPLSATARSSLGDSQSSNSSSDSRRSLKRSLSSVRLSLTSEGSAKVLKENEPSPSPPRPLTAEMLASRQSTSPTPAHKRRSSAGLHRGPSGRSRDPRAWEYWCDSESRNTLIRQADQELSGSAAAAIGLMRSKNHRGLFGSPHSDRGDVWSRPESLRARQDLGNAIPQLKKVRSSMARLGSESKPAFRLYEDADDADEASVLSVRQAHSPGNESDKENRNPNPMKQKPLNEGLHGRLPLGESRSVPGLQSPGLKLPVSSLRLESRLEDDKDPHGHKGFDPEEDEEIARFMAAGKARPDDLDCIQGLLSLSQGNWR